MGGGYGFLGIVGGGGYGFKFWVCFAWFRDQGTSCRLQLSGKHTTQIYGIPMLS